MDRKTPARKPDKEAPLLPTKNMRAALIENYLLNKQAEIIARQAARLDSLELTEARIETEISRIAFFDVRRIFDKNGDPIPIHELDDDTARVISGLEIYEEWTGSGKNRRFVGRVKKYRFADKNSALERAAKIRAMFTEDNRQRQSNPLVLLIAQLGASAATVIENDPDHV